MTRKRVVEPYGPAEVKEFKQLLLERRSLLAEDVRSLEREETGRREQDFLAPIHPAEQGTDAFDEAVSLERMESAGDELREVDRALARIGAGGYGLCEACGRRQKPGRLRAIPYARLCLPCKKKEEARP